MSAFCAETIQRACLEGDEKRLRLALRLDSELEFALNSSDVANVLSARGAFRVRQVTCSSPAKRPCLALEGTALELAICKAQFSCANLVLSVVLARRLVHSGTVCAQDLGISYPQMTANRVLAKLMYRLCREHGVRFHVVRFLYKVSGCSRLFTFLACCFLGESQLAGKLWQEAPSAYWRAADSNVLAAFRRNCVVEGPRSVAELGLLASSLGGNSACTQLLLHECHNDDVTVEAWYCLFKCSFVWTLSSLKNNLDFFQNAPIIRRGWPYPHPFELLARVVDRFGSLGHATSTDLCLFGDLPTQDEILLAAWKVLEPFEDDFSRQIARNLEQTLRLAVKVAGSMQPSSPVFEGMNRLLRKVFLAPPPRSLLDWNVSAVLVEVRPEQREAFLVTLAQFFRVRSRRRAPQLSSCPVCHPLVSLVVRAWQGDREALGEHLHVIAAYFSCHDLDQACRLLRALDKCRPCNAHSGFCRLWPSLRCPQQWTPQFVRLLQESKASRTLSGQAVLAILDSLDGDVDRLRSISMPGGLRRYFALDHFLRWWVPPAPRQ